MHRDNAKPEKEHKMRKTNVGPGSFVTLEAGGCARFTTTTSEKGKALGVHLSGIVSKGMHRDVEPQSQKAEAVYISSWHPTFKLE